MVSYNSRVVESDQSEGNFQYPLKAYLPNFERSFERRS